MEVNQLCQQWHFVLLQGLSFGMQYKPKFTSPDNHSLGRRDILNSFEITPALQRSLRGIISQGLHRYYMNCAFTRQVYEPNPTAQGATAALK